VGIHRILTGEGAETYLPFAESRLRVLEENAPGGTLSQTFTIGDATVRVKLVGEEKYIYITVEGGFYFEFSTTGWPLVPLNWSQYGVSGSLPAGVWVGTEVRTVNGRVSVAPYIRSQRRAASITDNLSINKWAVQVQCINEKVQYRELDATTRANFDFRNTVRSSWAATHSHTGLHERTTLLKPSYFSTTWQQALPEALSGRDVSYDAGFSYGAGRASTLPAVKLEDSADWPRENGIQTAKSEKWGDRQFAIYIDAFSSFHIFPLGSILRYGAEFHNVIPEHIRHIAPTYPSWCWMNAQRMQDTFDTSLSGTSKDLIGKSDYQWIVNHTGTKATAVIYARSLAENDSVYFADNASAQTPWTQAHWDDTLAPLMGGTPSAWIGRVRSLPDYLPETYFVAPGLVEATVDIRITGPNLNDYVAEVSIATIRDPNVTPYNTAVAGYSYIDIADKGITAGDLLCVDLEFWHAKRVDHQHDADSLEILRVKNLSKATTILSTRAHRIMAVDFSTCSLALKITHLAENVPVTIPTKQSKWNPVTWWPVPFVIEHVGVWIIHSGKTKEILYPDTMTEEHKAELVAESEIDIDAFLATRLAEHDYMDFIPLAMDPDGWTMGDGANYREWLSYCYYYWYNEAWVIYDPNVWVHGRSFPDEGFVQYRVAPPFYTGSTWSYNNLRHISSPPGSAYGHMMFVKNPRWGWHANAAVMAKYIGIHGWDTFFTHPNGSYAFYSDYLIYNPVGMPMRGGDYGVDGPKYNGLADYDVSKLEHCIFDRIWLDVRKSSGAAVPLKTTFIEMYNQAVRAGKEAETLEAGIEEIDRAAHKAVFTKEIVYLHESELNWPDLTTESLMIKAVVLGAEYWMVEQGVTGNYDREDPYYTFPTPVSGHLIGFSFLDFWYTQPWVEYAYNPVREPKFFLGTAGPSSWYVRFCNPQILMG
jgi:hypothetical protein